MTDEQKYSRKDELFDDWADRYDKWFSTPVGTLVKKYEEELLLDMLAPQPDERILDVGCGTGIFTSDVLSCGAKITGVDISYPMLVQAEKKTSRHLFQGLVGDMTALPFADESFDKVYSMTALEFVKEASTAIEELHRVVRPGGAVVVTTLNSLSPWAERRTEKAARGHRLFQNMTFRTPRQLEKLCPAEPTVKTAIHFMKDDDPEDIARIEEQGRADNAGTGAFIALKWRKQQGQAESP